MSRAVLYDSTRCIGCKACEQTCSERWKLPYNDTIAEEDQLSEHKLTAVRVIGDRYARKLCMHCNEPACASACPVAALYKTEPGPVVYREERCMGCRYCMTACPHQVPTYTWNSRLPVVRKCDMCSDRAAAGIQTRCSEICPAEATITGDRDAMIAEARKRIKEAPQSYFPQIYGIEEGGGTSVLVIGGISAEQLGYRANLPHSSLPGLTWAVLQHIPDIVIAGGALLSGVYWLTSRREDVAAAEGGHE
jgi:formate dehydrogenase iron-sulfur subunit